MATNTLLFLIVGLSVSVIVSQDSPQVVVLVADHGNLTRTGAIYKLNIHYMNLSVLNVPNVNSPVDIDYDKQGGHIYWTDIGTKEVKRADMDGGNYGTVARLNSTSSPEGLTLDTNTRQIFYTDRTNNIIVRIEMNTFRSTVIVSTGLEQPRGIVADNINRTLYWVDFGTDKIETCDYSGGMRRTVVSTGNIAPNGITLDEQARRLFWTDGAGHIESMLVNGTDRKKLMTEPGASFNGISTFNGRLYFTVFSNGRVYTLTEDGKHVSSLSSPRFLDPAGVHVFSPNVDSENSCPNGHYGLSCIVCGKCIDGSPCERTTGICLGGCRPGYKRPMCIETCDPGTFGVECESTCSRYCKAGSVCNHETGYCTPGCEVGWTGVYCNITRTCPPNTYGDCIPCGRCAGGSPCHAVTGYCLGGCQPGWTGDRCDSECPANTYGACLPCGRCAGDSVCDIISGYCLEGCMSGWKAPLCNTVCPDHTYRDCIPCGRCVGGAPCDALSGYCEGGCMDGWTGRKCDSADTKTSGPPKGTEGELPVGLIIGLPVGVAVVVIVLVIVAALCFVMRYRTRRRRPDEPYAQFQSGHKQEDDYATLEDINTSGVYTLPVQSRSATVGDAFS